MTASTGRRSFRETFARVTRFSPLLGGVLCVIVWLGLLVSLFAGWSADDEGSLIAAVILLAATIVAALSSLPARRRAALVACTAAVAHVAVFAYLRVGFDRMMPDFVLYLITAVYYLSPPAAGVASIVAWAGVRSREES